MHFFLKLLVSRKLEANPSSPPFPYPGDYFGLLNKILNIPLITHKSLYSVLFPSCIIPVNPFCLHRQRHIFHTLIHQLSKSAITKFETWWNRFLIIMTHIFYRSYLSYWSQVQSTLRADILFVVPSNLNQRYYFNYSKSIYILLCQINHFFK